LAFYRAAAESGGFLDATQAKTRPGAAKAMTDMYRKMAELGVPFATEMKIGFEGTGPMAEMMKKMGNTITTEVTSVSTAAVDAAIFEIPADYKVSKRQRRGWPEPRAVPDAARRCPSAPSSGRRDAV